MSGKPRRAGEVVHPPTARPERRVGNFLHGRVACPRCQAHNDALARICSVCGWPQPAGLPLLPDTLERVMDLGQFALPLCDGNTTHS
jgi:hypothetical protein